MRRTLLICLIMVMVPATLWAQLSTTPEKIREVHPNLVSGELGGKGIIYSINYERFFAQQFGLGVGIMGFGTSDGAVALIPLYVSLCPVGNVHSLYLSGGITLAVGSDNWDELEQTTLGNASIGYLYQSEGGVFVRPTINLIFKGEDFLILPGIAIGGSF
jgi:hypothetical protein